MPKRSIRITESARRDLLCIVEYIALDDQAAAIRLAEHIERHVSRLEDFPFLGVTPKNRRLARKGYRLLIVDEHIVFYCLPDEDTIEVRRIVSGKRNYSFLP